MPSQSGTEPSPREKVFAFLARAGEPHDAQSVAEFLGVHVSTARFHLRNLVDEGRVAAQALPSRSAGRPPTGYVVMPATPMQTLLGLLLDGLGDTAGQREDAGVAAGRQWAAQHARSPHAGDDGTPGSHIPAPGSDDPRNPAFAPRNPAARIPGPYIPDPLSVTTDALQSLGFRVSTAMSAFGNHELRICSCPLSDIAQHTPEVARGVVQGAIEHALQASSLLLAQQYSILAVPAPSGDCEITLRLTRHTVSGPVATQESAR